MLDRADLLGFKMGGISMKGLSVAMLVAVGDLVADDLVPEVLGEDANDPRWGIEKAMRDAKLGQIFEGTNQINRLHVARGLIHRA